VAPVRNLGYRRGVKTKLALAVALICLSAPASASAQVARTWVSQDGSDANDCSFSMPCLSFTRATDPLIEGGEINAQSDGNFGEFVIDKGMTVDGRGHSVSITGFGAGITVNAPGQKVTVRNLHIQGFPGSGDGIQVTAVGHLRLYETTIRTFDGNGVDFRDAPVPSRLTVLNSSISEVSNNGIFVSRVGSGAKRVLVRNSDISANDSSGIRAGPASPPASNPLSIGVFDSTLADNGIGIVSSGSNTRVRIAANVITGNASYGIRALDGGQILSYRTNRIYDNAIDGVATGTVNQN
jgi:Right handed beta helix region